MVSVSGQRAGTGEAGSVEPIAAIDAANAEDPRSHGGAPLALVQGRAADRWVLLLDPDASDALRFAARAHHLRRWDLPRSGYPDGRAGYLRWRREQKARHARDLLVLLEAAGVESSVSRRASQIVAKRNLGADPEVQVFEDAVCLTFLETEMRSVVERLDDDHKAADIVAKTLAKMSATGREHAAAVAADLDERCQRIVSAARATFGTVQRGR